MKNFTLTLAAVAGLALCVSLSACDKVSTSLRGMSSVTQMGGPLTAIASRRDYPMPVEHMSYAPNDPHYVRYVNTRTGTDTHHFKSGERSFVMRGTPPLSGVIEPWYDWNDIGNVGSKAVSFNDCGKCNLAMGAEMEITTQNLQGHTVTLELCYYTKGKELPQCFKGDTVPLQQDIKEWKKLSVSVPFEQFRTIAYNNARMRLSVDRGPQPEGHERFGKAGFEGVIWADNFRYLLAEQNGTDSYNVKLSGALWPDDYSGWETGMGKPIEPLQAWKR